MIFQILIAPTSFTTGPRENLNNWHTSPRLDRLLARTKGSGSLTPVNNAGNRCWEYLGTSSPQILVAFTNASPIFILNSGDLVDRFAPHETEKQINKHTKTNFEHQSRAVNPLNSHEWLRKNFSLQCQYNIIKMSEENKEKYQFGDN